MTARSTTCSNSRTRSRKPSSGLSNPMSGGPRSSASAERGRITSTLTISIYKPPPPRLGDAGGIGDRHTLARTGVEARSALRAGACSAWRWLLGSSFARGGHRKADAEASRRHARAAVAYGADLVDGARYREPAAVDGRPSTLRRRRARSSGRLTSTHPARSRFFFGAQAHAYGGDHALAEDYATSRFLRLYGPPRPAESFMALNALLGIVRGLAGRLDEAVSSYSKAVQANPRFSFLYAFRAAALAHAGRTDEAATAASRMLAMQPHPRVASLSPFRLGILPQRRAN